jgi:antitoxin CptB
MTDEPHADHHIRLKRVKFRASHRGFLEADIILGLFAEAHAESLSLEELQDFEALLEQPDHALYGWILDREATPDVFADGVIVKIKAFVPEAHRQLSDGG